MSEQNAVVAVYDTHVGAEEAVKELQRAGIDMHTLSIVGKDTHTDEHVVGYYNTGDRMKYWGKIGRFLGRLLGIVVRVGLLCHSGHRSRAGGGPPGCVDRGSAGRRRGRWRLERRRRGAQQHGNSEGQRRSVRTGAQDGQVPADGAWHGRRKWKKRESIIESTRPVHVDIALAEVAAVGAR